MSVAAFESFYSHGERTDVKPLNLTIDGRVWFFAGTPRRQVAPRLAAELPSHRAALSFLQSRPVVEWRPGSGARPQSAGREWCVWPPGGREWYV